MITYANDTIFEDTCSGCYGDCSKCSTADEDSMPDTDQEDLFETLAEATKPKITKSTNPMKME